MSIRVDREVLPGQLLFDERQAARMLGIGPDTLALLKIRRVSIRTRRLYHIEDLREFADKARQAS